MSQFRPKYVTFDCYGTLTRFQMGELARAIFCDRIPADRMDAFIRDFAAYRFDEVLGAWKPYDQVLCNALERSCRRWGLAYVEAGAAASTRRFGPRGRIQTCPSRSGGWRSTFRW